VSGQFFLDDGRQFFATFWQERPPDTPSFLLTLPFPGSPGPLWRGLPLCTFWPRPSSARDPEPPDTPPDLRPLEVRFHPPKEVFLQRVARALEAVDSGRMVKIVVARAVEVVLDHAPSIAALRTLLWREKSPNETAFLVAHPSGIFLGLTPETLFQMVGRKIQIDLLAGTAPEPQGLLRPHLEEEHALVGEGVQKALEDLLVHHTVEDLPPRPAGTVWHRFARFTGEVREGVSWKTVLARLHPTPALGGYPREAALAWIQQEEGGLRGLYGGVVGWVSRNRCALYVAIRSGLLRGNRLFLFAGGGVVRGHTPEELWVETALKIRRLAGALLSEPLPF